MFLKIHKKHALNDICHAAPLSRAISMLCSPRQGWAVVTNTPRLEWAIGSNISLERLTKICKLSKPLNRALCFGNVLLLAGE